MSKTELYITSTFLIIILSLLITHHMEKQQLLKTIEEMGKQIKAKDLMEYRSITEETPKFEPVTRTEQDEWAQEIEENKRL